MLMGGAPLLAMYHAGLSYQKEEGAEPRNPTPREATPEGVQGTTPAIPSYYDC